MSLVARVLFCVLFLAGSARGATTTTLEILAGGSPVSTVSAGTVVTLSATVSAGSGALTTGQVGFCDADARFCTDIHLVATAQLTPAGTATFKFVPGAPGQSVTLTASLAPDAAQNHDATGTVTFSSDGNSIGTGSVANGVASWTGNTLPAGSDTLTAVYAGDTNFATSTSNNVPFTSGAATPPAALMEPVGSTSAVQTATLTFTTGGTLGAIAVLTQGAQGLDFDFVAGGTCAIGVTYAAGATCTVNYSFKPTHPGPRNGGITLTDSSGALLSNAYISGTGTGPQVTYSPGSSSVVAGGFADPIGIAVDGAGNIFTIDGYTSTIKEFFAVDGYKTSVMLAQANGNFISPWFLAVDGCGNLIVSDPGSRVVKEILAVGGYTTVTTIGGNFGAPYGVAVDGSGNVFVSDAGDSAVKEILAAGGYTTVKTLGGAFSNPLGIAVDGSGNLFVADNPNNNTNIVELVAAGGYATVTTLGSGLDGPVGIAVDGVGNVYIADSHNNAVKKLMSANNYATTITIWTGAAAYPLGVAIDSSGNVYISEDGLGQIAKLDVADPPTLTFATTPVGSTSSDSPKPVTIYNEGNAPLVFSVPANGDNPQITPGFDIGGNSTCPQTVSSALPYSLAPGASCTAEVSFSPVAPGADTGELVIADNNLNVLTASQVIPLNGTAPGTAAPPTVTSVSPNNGPAAGGTTVTITGTNFSGAMAVGFGSVAAASYTVDSTTSITAVSPAGASTVDITVTTAGGTSATSVNDQFTYAVSTQTITFPPPATPAYLGTSVLLTATGGASGNPVVFSVVSGPAMVSGTNGSTLTYSGPGIVVVEADQAAGGGYPAAPPVQITLNPVVLTEPVGTSSPAISTLVTFQTAGTLADIQSYTRGVAGLDFSLSTGGTCNQSVAYTAGQTCVLEFGFAPTHPGQRFGGAVITTASGTVLATSYFYGVGTGPQVTFSPGTQTALPGTIPQAAGTTVDGAGDVFVASLGSGLYEIPVNGTAQQIGTFPDCQDVTVDGIGNVFVLSSDTTLSELLAVNGTVPASPVIVTISSQFDYPTSVKVDGLGNVYVSGVGSLGTGGGIYKVLAVDGSIPASPVIQTLSTAFSGPTGVAVDASGNLYVSDQVQNAVFEVMAVNGSIPASPTILTLATGLTLPSNITLDAAGDVFVSDYGDSDVKEILAVSGSIPANNPTVLSLGSGLVAPQGLFVDQSGNVFVADAGLTQAIELDYADPPALSFAATIVGQTSSDSPQSVALTNDGNAPLIFATPGSGFNPAITPGFTIGGASTCPMLGVTSASSQLAEGASCTDLVSFMPVSVGTIAGQLVTTDNALNMTGATQTVPLNGVALNLTVPTITFSVADQTLGNPPFTVAAVSNSPGAITYSVVSGPATIFGSTVTLTGAGAVELEASQAASGIYAAGTATATFNVGKKLQTITFALVPLLPAGAPPVTLVATASSGLPVSFSVLSGPATVSGTILTFTGTGNVVVAANQPGNAQYAAAPTVIQIVSILSRLAVGLVATPNLVFLNNPVTLTATFAFMGPAPSGTVTFLDGTQAIGTAALSGQTAAIAVSTLGLGTHSITASFGGSADYASAASAPAAVTVEDFTLTTTSSNVVIDHGGTANVTLNLAPVGGPGMAAPIAFTLTGQPEESAVTFTPASIAGGSGQTSVTLVIKTPNYPTGATSSAAAPARPGRWLLGTSVAFCGIFCMAGRLRTSRCTPLGRLRGLLLLIAAAMASAGLGGCGSGWKTQTGPISVSAQSGQLTRSVTFLLTSECKDGQPACPITTP